MLYGVVVRVVLLCGVMSEVVERAVVVVILVASVVVSVAVVVVGAEWNGEYNSGRFFSCRKVR